MACPWPAKKNGMALSVIIPCYNAGDTLGLQLEALARQHWTEPWEVIVADNGSTDRSPQIIEAYEERCPNLRRVDASARQGQAYARNLGAARAHGAALAFCDADDEVAPGWVAAMGQALGRHDFVGCRLDASKLNAPWLHAAYGDPQKEDFQKIWYPPYLPYAGGGTLGIKRALHEAVGGFDETLACLEDTDYCFRLQLLGVPLIFVKEAVIYLRFRTKFRAIFHQSRHWAEYNVKVYKKYRRLTGETVVHPWPRYWRHWKHLVRGMPRLRRKKDLAGFMWKLGWQIGLLQGSIKNRIHPVPL